MKLDLRTKVLGYDNKPVIEAGQELTFKEVINAALNNMAPGEVMTPEDKSLIYRLSVNLWEHTSITFTHSDCAFIEKRAGASLSPLMLGRLHDFLEGKSAKADEPAEDNAAQA